MWAWIRDLAKERLLGWFTPAQGMETDALMGEVDLATYQAMQPMRGNAKGPTKQSDIAVLVAAAQEDHGPGQRGAQVECEARRRATPQRSCLAAGGGLSAMGGDVTRRDVFQGGHAAAMMSLPDLGLPKGVEPFDGILETRLARGCEHRNHPQRQAQAADAPDRIGELVSTLEDRIVVELGVAGQPMLAPVPEQGIHSDLGAGPRHDPGRREGAMQADAGEHRHQRAVGVLQVLDEVEAVEFGFSCGQIGQIPTLGWRRAALPMRRID